MRNEILNAPAAAGPAFVKLPPGTLQSDAEVAQWARDTVNKMDGPSSPTGYAGQSNDSPVACFLVASCILGADEHRIAEVLSLDPEHVAKWARNLRENYVWQDGGRVEDSTWFDESCGAVAFALAMLVAEGQVKGRMHPVSLPLHSSYVLQKLRGYRHPPPAEKLVRSLLPRLKHPLPPLPPVELICGLFRRAMEACGGDRKDASVLCAMELGAREGERIQLLQDIASLAGQQLQFVKASLTNLCRQGAVDEVRASSSCTGYELTKPVLAAESPRSLEQSDPIRVLRLDRKELDVLPEDSLRQLASWAALQAAHERLAKEEAETLSKIASREALQAEDEKIYSQAQQRLCQHERAISTLKRTLSAIRWSKRHPFERNTGREPLRWQW